MALVRLEQMTENMTLVIGDENNTQEINAVAICTIAGPKNDLVLKRFE